MFPLDLAVRGSIVLAVGLLVCLALRTRAAALRHAVLVATLIAAPIIAPLGMLLPPVDVAVPRFLALPRSVSSPGTPGTRSASDAGVANDLMDAPARSPRASTSSVRPSSGPGWDNRPSRALSSRWTTVVLGVWALGTALLLGGLLIPAVQLARAIRKARPITDARWSEALASTARAADVRRVVALCESPRRELLATWGWRTPYLLVPADALDWPLERIRIVLGHELAHVQRMDWAWQVLGAVVRAVFWWNPLAWLAFHRLSVESERACDDAVLALGVAPHTYAEELVAVARALRISPSLPAIAVSMARPSTLHQRITAMLDPHLQRSTPGRLTTALLVGAVLALLVPIAAIRGASAQAPLEGVVYDSTGAVVPEVRLSLSANGRKVEATTDAEGRFAFAGTEPGTYTLEGAQRGFKLLRQTIELKQPADWTRVITLQLGDVKETISVRGRRGSGVAAPPAGPVRVRVGGNIRPPKKLVDVKPIYPEASQEAGREGTVEIEAVIGKDGSVTAARVTSPEVHPELATAALEAVRQWKFSATLLNGNPVEVVMNVSVSFTLE